MDRDYFNTITTTSLRDDSRSNLLTTTTSLQGDSRSNLLTTTTSLRGDSRSNLLTTTTSLRGDSRSNLSGFCCRCAIMLPFWVNSNGLLRASQ